MKHIITIAALMTLTACGSNTDTVDTAAARAGIAGTDSADGNEIVEDPWHGFPAGTQVAECEWVDKSFDFRFYDMANYSSPNAVIKGEYGEHPRSWTINAVQGDQHFRLILKIDEHRVPYILLWVSTDGNPYSNAPGGNGEPCPAFTTAAFYRYTYKITQDGKFTTQLNDMTTNELSGTFSTYEDK